MTQRGQAVPNPKKLTGRPITVILPGFLDAAAVDVTSNWLRISETFVLDGDTSIYYVAKGAPSSSLGINIRKSVDGGVSFSSILSSPLSLSGHVQHITPTWLGGDLEVGDLLRVDITTADTSSYGVLLQIIRDD